MHGDLGSRRDSIVLVGLEARIHTTLHRIAGRGESGLSNGVVLAQESEDDHIAYGCLDFRWRISQTCRTTDLDRVSSPGSRYDTRGAGGDGRGSYGAVCCAGCNCLRNRHGLVDCRGLGIGARVHPDDDNLSAGSLNNYTVGTAQALQVTISCLYRVDISDSLSHS